MKRLILIGGLAATCAAAPAAAQPSDETQTQMTTAQSTSVRSEGTEDDQRRVMRSAGWPRLGEGESSGSPWGAAMALFGLLGAAGVSSIFLKRKKMGRDEGDVIDIVASRVVAPRTKVVLLSTHHREVLISVSDKGATLLTEWLSDDAPAAREAARFEPSVEASHESEALLELAARAQRAERASEMDEEDSQDLDIPEPSSTPRKHSEAVAGLLELRRKAHETPPKGRRVMKSKVPTLDTDSEWTRRLMSEMRSQGGQG